MLQDQRRIRDLLTAMQFGLHGHGGLPIRVTPPSLNKKSRPQYAKAARKRVVAQQRKRRLKRHKKRSKR